MHNPIRDRGTVIAQLGLEAGVYASTKLDPREVRTTFETASIILARVLKKAIKLSSRNFLGTSRRHSLTSIRIRSSCRP